VVIVPLASVPAFTVPPVTKVEYTFDQLLDEVPRVLLVALGVWFPELMVPTVIFGVLVKPVALPVNVDA
jgi:hypothetical protein